MPEANMFMEKRVCPRIAVKIPVKYRLTEDEGEVQSIEEWRKSEKHAQTMDLSLDGMYITVDQKLPVGSLFRFDLALPNMETI